MLALTANICRESWTGVCRAELEGVLFKCSFIILDSSGPWVRILNLHVTEIGETICWSDLGCNCLGIHLIAFLLLFLSAHWKHFGKCWKKAQLKEVNLLNTCDLQSDKSAKLEKESNLFYLQKCQPKLYLWENFSNSNVCKFVKQDFPAVFLNIEIPTAS